MRHVLNTLVLLCLAQISFAQQLNFWTGAVSADWFDANNWTLGLPQNGQKAVIPNATASGNKPEIYQPLTADFEIANYGQISAFAPVTNLQKFFNNATVVNRSEFKVAATFENNAVFQNGCANCDSTGVGLTILPDGEFENKSTIVNQAKMVIEPCGIAYFDSPTKTSLGGDIRLNGVAYVLKGDVDFSELTGTVLFDRWDVPRPSLLVQDVTLQLDANGQATLTQEMVDDGTTAEYCTLASFNLSRTNFNCDHVGPNLVFVTATDGMGNSYIQFVTVTVLASAYCGDPCQNVLTGGVVFGTQTICVGTAANPIQNLVAPVGGSGAAEYVWIKWTVDPLTNPDGFAMIPNSNSENYAPGVLTQTTWFRRCSRRVGCQDFRGETNFIKITVTAQPPVAVCESITVQLQADGTVAITAADIDGGSSGVCGAIANYSIDQSVFYGAATYSVVLTVTNVAGQTSTCTSTVVVDPPPCDNVLNGGTIFASDYTCDQIGSTIISNNEMPTGGIGPIEFEWHKWLTDPATNPGGFSIVPGIAAENLDAGFPDETTWFARLARRSGCGNFTAQSNIVKIVPTNQSVEVTLTHPDCASATGSILLENLPEGFSARIDNGIWEINQSVFQNLAPGAHTLSIKYGVETRSANFTLNPAVSKNALLVVGSTTLNSGDNWIKNRLESLGLSVTVKDDDLVAATDANGKNLVLISSTITSGAIGTKFTNAAVPVICYEPYLFDELKMTPAVADSDHGTSSGGVLNLVAPAHPIAGGLSGNISVYSVSTTQTWGKPAAAATKIAYASGSTSRAAIFAYPAGASMSGLNAPARRVGFFLHDATATSLTADGRRLFDNTIKWAIDCQRLNNLAATAAQNALTFNAYRKNFDVDLKWISLASGETATNDYFVIERSADGKNFQPIRKTDARGTAGELQYFNERDENPLEGDNFYRLKLVSLNGNVSFSNIQNIHFEPLDGFEIFPNPVQEKFFVNLKNFKSQETLVRLFDFRGILVQSWTVVPGNEPVEFQADAGLSNGIYLINVNAAGQRGESKKIVFEKGN